MRLSCARLSVRKDARVEPLDDGVQCRHKAGEHIFLDRLGAENSIESALDRLVGPLGVANAEARLVLVDIDHLVCNENNAEWRYCCVAGAPKYEKDSERRPCC